MCVAVFKPKNAIIDRDRLQACFENNSDGAGFMYTDGGRLHVRKGFFTFDEFMAAYEPHQRKKVVLHFRIRTHGATNAENCHPYQIDGNMAFVHNGVIGKVDDSSDKTKSDTWHFNEQFIKPMHQMSHKFIRNQAIYNLVKEYIGYSKLVFMSNRGDVTIVNERMGEWADGVWYSNGSYRPWGRRSQKVAAVERPKSEYLPPARIEGESTMGKSVNGDTSKKPTGSSSGSLIVHKSSADFKAGDYVSLTCDYRGLKEGTIGEVLNFHTGYMCDILVGDEDVYGIPYWALELLDVEELAHYFSVEAGYYGDTWE